MYLAFITSPTTVEAAGASSKWHSCKSCSQAGASIIAENKAPPLIGYGYLETSVYVVSIDTRSVYKFDVYTSREPGLYSRNVIPMSVESSVHSGMQEIWEAVPENDSIDLPPELSEDAGSYIANPNDRGRVSYWLDNNAEGFLAQLRGLAFSGTVYSNQALAAIVADRGPVLLTLKFTDGSIIKVKISVGVDGQSNAISLESVEIVPGSAMSADGNTIPTEASGFYGYEATNITQPTVNLLEALANRFGLQTLRWCGGNSRFSCDSNGRCTVHGSC